MILATLIAAYLAVLRTNAIEPTQCCMRGYERGVKILTENKRKTCDPDANLTKDYGLFNKLLCIGMFKTCCKTTAASQFCQMGVRTAIANHMCTRDHRVGGEHQHTCCNCCKRGKVQATHARSCTITPNAGDDDACIAAFQDCCKISKLGKTSRRTTCASVTCASVEKECVEDGQKTRCRCKRGLRGEGDKCVDIDECSSGQYNCMEHSRCVNTKGSYQCVCATGYTVNGDKCVIIPKSCSNGYEVKNGTCQDIDECLSGTDRCPQNTYCFNTDKDYRCVTNCPHPNYQVIKVGVCTDTDECEKKIHNCPKNFQCINTIGGFDCKRVRCDEGYKLIKGYCHDIDECKDKYLCGTKGVCRNADGTYYCHCQRGYDIDPVTRKCADVDECKLNQAHCNYKCINTEGSYRCSCPEGYEMRSRYCYDKDECRRNPCSQSTQCFNTFGSYACINETCPSAFYEQRTKRIGGLKSCHKVDCRQNIQCSKLTLEAVKISASKFYKLVNEREFTFNYWLTYSSQFYRVTYNFVSGNEDGYFKIANISHGHIRITNQRKIRGPKTIHLVLHTDIISRKENVLKWRYEYHFYIFLSAYNRFGSG